MRTPAVFLALPFAMADVPDAFDSRKQWPECTTPVRDAGDSESGVGCASEWAMAATQTLQTNLCVLGKPTPMLSAEEVGSCFPKLSNLLCSNWVIPTAWSYIDQFGVHAEECVPYTGSNLAFDTCQQLRNASSTGSCTNASAAENVYRCPVPSTVSWDDAALQGAIMQGGAVEVTITAMRELWNYTGGIYNPMPEAPEPREELAIKLVGWGEEDSKFYWIAENTWGSSWGENGYFRVTNNAGSNFINVSPGRACIGSNQTALI